MHFWERKYYIFRWENFTLQTQKFFKASLFSPNWCDELNKDLNIAIFTNAKFVKNFSLAWHTAPHMPPSFQFEPISRARGREQRLVHQTALADEKVFALRIIFLGGNQLQEYLSALTLESFSGAKPQRIIKLPVSEFSNLRNARVLLEMLKDVENSLEKIRHFFILSFSCQHSRTRSIEFIKSFTESLNSCGFNPKSFINRCFANQIFLMRIAFKSTSHGRNDSLVRKLEQTLPAICAASWSQGTRKHRLLKKLKLS